MGTISKASALMCFVMAGTGAAFGATTYTLGSANDGNCYPFNCNDSGSATGQSIEYQQVFDATQFGAGGNITSITFFDQFLPGLGFANVPLLSGSYTISLAVTSAAVGGLSTNLASNITSGEATFLVDAGDPGVGAGFSTLTFNGTPYFYNPASGNLLLDIVVTNQANVTSASYSPANGFDAEDAGTSTSRAYQIGTQAAVADGNGLVTAFDVSTSAVPEPGTYALMGGALVALAAWKKRKMGGVALAALLAAGLSASAWAQPLNIQPRTIAVPLHSAGGAAAPVNAAGPTVTIPNWSSTFTIGGTGYPQSFVGTDPTATNTTTNVTVPVIPVILVLNNGAGPRFDPTKKLNTAPAGSALSATLATLTSPLFQNATYSTGGTTVGTNVQFGDAILRATWWNYPSSSAQSNWHTVLKPQLKPAVTLTVPTASGSTSGPFALVDLTWLGGQLDALSTNYGATNFPLFLFYEVLETENSGATCCVLGYHTALQSGNSIQTYGMGTYLDPNQIGAGAGDVSVLSHEVSEWLNDPFVNNTVPAWPAPFSFTPPGPPYTAGQCQNNLETGDPIEDRTSASVVVFHITTFGRQYTLQNEALAPWFLQAAPSFAVLGYYTYLGPIDSEFNGPAPACQ